MKMLLTSLHKHGYLYKSSFHGHLSLIAPDWGAKNDAQMKSQEVRKRYHH